MRFRDFLPTMIWREEKSYILIEFSSTVIEMFINSVFVGNNNLLLTFFCTNCFVADISKSHSDSLTSFLPQFCLSISAALILSESDLQKSFYLPVRLPVLPACLPTACYVFSETRREEKNKWVPEWMTKEFQEDISWKFSRSCDQEGNKGPGWIFKHLRLCMMGREDGKCDWGRRDHDR